MRKIRSLLAAIFAITALVSQGTGAQVLYGADGAGGNLANLYILNPTTGAIVSTVGPIGFAVTGMAFHPTTGVLYATTGPEVNPAVFIRINTTTGAGTLIGPAVCGPVADITFRSDGTLFGWSECNDGLVTINLATGAETEVGATGLGTAGSGIAFSPGGTLFFTGHNSNGNLETINPATGVPSTVATMTGGPPPNRINALAFNGAGVLYGSLKGSPGSLITINTTTGVVTTVGTTVTGLDAIAFGPGAGPVAGPSASVPTLSQWAIIALGLLIAGSVLLRRRA